MLHDMRGAHLNMVSATVRIMEAYMDYSPTAATLFRDLGGLSAMIERLGKELLSDGEQLQAQQQQQGGIGMDADQAAAAAAAASSQPGTDRGKQPAADPAASVVSGTLEVPAAVAADGTPTQETTVTYAKRLLLKSLLRAIALASYAPGTGRCTSKACSWSLPLLGTFSYSQACTSCTSTWRVGAERSQVDHQKR